MRHGWWWHLFNDPMRSNAASVVALLALLALSFACIWNVPSALRMAYRRRREYRVLRAAWREQYPKR